MEKLLFALSGKRILDRLPLASVFILGLMMAGMTPIANAQVVSRDSNVYGNTQGDWSARWIQWLLSIPAATNPALDATGTQCGNGQSGPVWFLAGTFGGEAFRDCTVPAGKSVFFPILNGFFGAGVFDYTPTVPTTTCNIATLRAAATASMDSVIISADLDGHPLDVSKTRVQSPVYSITYPDGNVVGLHGGKAQHGTYSPNVADGYWVMLTPLSAGHHVLHFKGEITAGVFAGNVIEVTYNLTQL